MCKRISVSKNGPDILNGAYSVKDDCHSVKEECCAALPSSHCLQVFLFCKFDSVARCFSFLDIFCQRSKYPRTVTSNPPIPLLFFGLTALFTLIPINELFSQESDLEMVVAVHGSMVGAVVRSLFFHQCGPGSIHIYVS